MNDLIVTPHPLTLEGQRIVRAAELRPGETLLTFLGRSGVDLSAPGWVVSIGGQQVPALMWSRTRPRHAQLIECRRVPGKQVIAIVAIAVLAYFTFGIGLAAGGAGTIGATLAGVGTFGAFAINVGVYMLGSMLINKLLGPTKARGSQYEQQATATSPTYSLAGGRNQMRPFEPIGLVFGIVKVVPDYGAQPYAWFEGMDQYQFIRLHGGINCGSVDQLLIGQTPIGSYDGVTVSQAGFPGTATVIDNWSSVDTVAGAVLDAATSPGAWVVRTSSAGTVRLAVDIGMNLYAMNDRGGLATATVEYDAEYRLLPAGGWLPFNGSASRLSTTSQDTKPIRLTLQTDVLASAQYEVRLRKVTGNVATTTASNAMEWASLKSYQADTSDYSDLPQVGIKIKASGQLNGALDAVSWVAPAVPAPAWTGGGVQPNPIRNPGAQILQFARGIFSTDGRLMAGMGLPDDQIDVAGLQAFTLHCANKGYVFDHWFDSPLSCMELLEAIAAAGLGSISFHPGKLSVVWLDEDEPLSGVISMANIKAGSFRVDYATRESAEEIEVTWYDRDAGWTPASLRVLAPGVTTPRETARYAPLGVTTQAGALRAARMAMAQNIYQRKSVTWEMDLEHLNFRRYSVVALAHDLTQWGYGGRLRSAVDVAGVVTLELDSEVPFNSAATARAVGLRIPGEQGYRIFNVAAFTGEAHTLTLSEPWPVGVAFPGDSIDNPAHDTLYVYDFAAVPGKRLLISSIEPGSNMGGAKITAVPAPEEFWEYFNSGDYVAPPSPAAAVPLVASNAIVTQQRVGVNYDNTTELTVTFDVAGPFDHAQVWGGPTGSVLQWLGDTRTHQFSGWRVGNDGDVDVEVRPFDGLGRLGTVATATHTVVLGALLLASGLAIKINVGDFAGSLNYNEAYLHGVGVSGEPADVPGKINVNGVLKAVPNGPLNTNRGPVPNAYVMWDMAGANFLFGATPSRHYVMARRNAGAWEYDNNDSGWIAITPGAQHVVIGTIATGATDAGAPGSPPGITSATVWAGAMDCASAAAMGDAADSVAVAAAAAIAAAAANAALAAFANDNILAAGEKPAVIVDWSEIADTQAIIDAQASAYGITTEKSAYDSAVMALAAYLSGLSPGWADLTADTPIVGTTFRSKFSDAYTARQAVLNKIAEIAGTRASWTGVGGRPKTFRLVSVGLSSTTHPVGANLYDGETSAVLLGGGPMYAVAIIRKSDAAIVASGYFNPLSGALGALGECNAMAALLNSYGPAYLAAIGTYDEPATDRLLGNLPAAMYRCGASRAVWGSPRFQFRGAYALVGTCGGGEGNGQEQYQGDVSADTNAWCDIAFQLLNGQLLVTGGSTPRTLADYSYTGDLNASATISLINDGGMSVSGSTVEKTGGAANTWDSAVHSAASYGGGAFAAFVPAQTTAYFMVGLNSDPTTDASYASIDYALYCTGAGHVEVYLNGSYRNIGDPVYAAGVPLSITYDGGAFRAYQGATLIDTYAAVVTAPLFLDSSFHTVGAKATNLQFGPLVARNATYRQTSAPTTARDGDLWFDIDDANKQYIREAGAWVSVRDADISNALSAASTAQSTADGKIAAFYASTAPAAADDGDLWFDIDDGNKAYTWQSGAWYIVADTRIASAVSAAATAQSTADGKITTYFASSAPTADAVGDLWYDTDDTSQPLYRWSGSAWNLVSTVGARFGVNISGQADTPDIADFAISDDYFLLSAKTYPIGVERSFLGVDGIVINPAYNCRAQVTVIFDGHASGGFGESGSGFALFACPTSDISLISGGPYDGFYDLGFSTEFAATNHASTTRATYTLTYVFDLTAGIQYRCGLSAFGQLFFPSTHRIATVDSVPQIFLVERKK